LSAGCVKTAECGLTFDVALPPLTEATVSYKFMFSDGYVFGKGGKLPGLCSEDCPSGCSKVGPDTGFSARIMWRDGGDMMSYSYFAGMPADTHCGDNWYWNKVMTSGGWNDIKMYVKTNSPGQANGAQRVELNGQTVYNNNAIKWSEKGMPITKFTFRCFHGGSGPEWASAQDQYVYFDDIKVEGGSCGGGGGSVPVAPTTPAPAEEPAEEPAEAPEDEPQTKTVTIKEEPQTTFVEEQDYMSKQDKADEAEEQQLYDAEVKGRNNNPSPKKSSGKRAGKTRGARPTRGVRRTKDRTRGKRRARSA
jgi:hypothetical protein